MPLFSHYCKDCEFMFNLAGISRPQNQEDFMKGNYIEARGFRLHPLVRVLKPFRFSDYNHLQINQ